MGKLILEANDIYKRFGRTSVLRGVSLALRPCESLVLLGRSGCGKSVLLKTLLGLQAPTSGSVQWLGEPLTRATQEAHMQHIGVVFQGSALFDSLLVWQNIAFAQWHVPGGLKDAEAILLAQDKLEAVGLDPEVAFLSPEALSGGMKRRVALARAVAFEPHVLCLDEPTAGLDPIASRQIAELIATQRKQLGVAVLMITHDLSCARAVADTLGVLSEGHLVWRGTFAELAHADHPEVRMFAHSAQA